MSNTKDLMEFIAILQSEFSDKNPYHMALAAEQIIRLGRRHHRLAEIHCSRDFQPNEAIQYGQDPNNVDEVIDESSPLYKRTIEYKLGEVSEEFFDGKLGFKLSGDPRGVTVKLVVPSGRTNDFGGEGIRVPGA